MQETHGEFSPRDDFSCSRDFSLFVGVLDIFLLVVKTLMSVQFKDHLLS